MQSEDFLLIGTALVVVCNRAFTATNLALSRPAYVVLQVVNLSAVVALSVFRLEGYPPKLDLAVRVFLMLFVAWHMVTASQGRTKARLDARDESRRVEDKQKERDELRTRLEAHDAELGQTPATEPSGDEPAPDEPAP